MFKCSKCIFCVKDGFRDMGFSCDTCNFIETIELRKGSKGDIMKSLISNDSFAESCPYFMYVCEVVDLVKNIKKISR